jgi:hypothetical protein
MTKEGGVTNHMNEYNSLRRGDRVVYGGGLEIRQQLSYLIPPNTILSYRVGGIRMICI